MNRDRIATRIAPDVRHILRQMCADDRAVNRKSERCDRL